MAVVSPEVLEPRRAEEADTDAPVDGGGRWTWPVVAAVGLLVAPPVVDLLLSGTKRLFSYTAADAFYYLRVADVWGDSGRLSFDGERPTNGFHPLWQLLLAGVSRVLRWLGLSRTVLVGVAVVGGLLLLAVALVVLGRAIRRAYGTVPAAYAALPVGLYALTLVPLWVAFGDQRGDSLPGMTDIPLYGTLWSFANGLETGAVVLAFALVVAVVVRWGFVGRRAVLGITAGCGLPIMARLDTALVVAGLLLALLGLAALRRDLRPAGTAVLVAGGLAAVVAVYVVWNKWYAGSWVPVSGSSKSTFPHPMLDNLRDIRLLLTGDDTSFGRGRLYREWPMIVPAVVAGAWLLASLRPRALEALRRGDPGDALVRYRVALTGTAIGTLLLTGYDLFFVDVWDQGHWYLPVPIVFVSLAGLDCLQRMSAVRARPGVVLGLCAALAVAVFVTLGRPERYHQRFADFHVDEAARVRAFYGDEPPKLLAWDDGADAFSLGFPSMNGRVLMLDREGIEAYEDGRLLALAVERGYDRFSSVQYLDADGLTRTTPSAQIRRRLEEFFPGEDLRPFEFSAEYAGRPGLTPPWPGADERYVIIAIRPR
jgi:hypothetical protein